MAKTEHIEFACMLAIEARETGAVCDNGSLPRTPHLIARDVVSLIKIARRENGRFLHVNTVGPMTDRMTSAAKRDAARAAEIAGLYGAAVHSAAAGRMRLILKSGARSVGSDGWGVPV